LEPPNRRHAGEPGSPPRSRLSGRVGAVELAQQGLTPLARRTWSTASSSRGRGSVPSVTAATSWFTTCEASAAGVDRSYKIRSGTSSRCLDRRMGDIHPCRSYGPSQSAERDLAGRAQEGRPWPQGALRPDMLSLLNGHPIPALGRSTGGHLASSHSHRGRSLPLRAQRRPPRAGGRAGRRDLCRSQARERLNGA
jgi:hypothetical protein